MANVFDYFLLAQIIPSAMNISLKTVGFVGQELIHTLRKFNNRRFAVFLYFAEKSSRTQTACGLAALHSVVGDTAQLEHVPVSRRAANVLHRRKHRERRI